MKKYYLIYQIKNKQNGMIYIGQHQTYDINDGYMGSGVRIVRAIKKYGIENFEKNILFECSSEEEMNQKEAEIVNEEFISRDDVYNIELGGVGGWTHLSTDSKSQASKKRWENMTQEQKEQIKYKCSIKSKQWNANVDKKQWKKKISDGVKKWYKEHPERHRTKYCHSQETKRKLSERMKNPHINIMSQSIWIYNEITLENKIHPKDKPIPEGWKRGRAPTKMIDKSKPAHLRCWINDGHNSKFILKDEKDKFIENGWSLGRLQFIK